MFELWPFIKLKYKVNIAQVRPQISILKRAHDPTRGRYKQNSVSLTTSASKRHVLSMFICCLKGLDALLRASVWPALVNPLTVNSCLATAIVQLCTTTRVEHIVFCQSVNTYCVVLRSSLKWITSILIVPYVIQKFIFL